MSAFRSLRERCFQAYIASARMARRLALLFTFGLRDSGLDHPGGTARLIRLTYESVFARAPDPNALEKWTVLLNAGQKDFGQFLRSLLESDEFAARAIDFVGRRAAVGDMRLMQDHSQYGEIRLLLREMVNAAAKYRIVVDIGAHGILASNSFDLMKYFGWRGLLIEPNTQLLPEITAAFEGLDCALLNTAVSDYDGKAILHLGVTSAISSLHRASVEQWGEARGEIEVPVRRLPPILESHDVPRDFDLLSIDSEGEDLRILNDVCSNGYRPRWVIFEAYEASNVKSLAELELLPIVVDSYDIVAQTFSNLVLRSNQLTSA